MVTLAEDLYLLAAIAAAGRRLIDVAHLDLGLGGALLLDLALRKRVVHADEQVTVTEAVRPANRCWTVPWLPSRSRADCTARTTGCVTSAEVRTAPCRTAWSTSASFNAMIIGSCTSSRFTARTRPTVGCTTS